MTRLHRYSFASATLLCAHLALMGCSSEERKPTAPAAATATDPSVVQPADSLVKQLQLAPAAEQPVSDLLRVAGRVEFDEQRLARIGATVTGRITQIHAMLGQSVHKGETLALLNSNELSDAQLAYIKSRAQMELHRRNADRAKMLHEADVIGTAERQRRESEFEIASAETRAARDQLRVLGLSDEAIEQLGRTGHIDSITPVQASLNGIVVERQVTQGQVVQPSDVLFAVADLSRVWVVAEVPEQQTSLVTAGQSVSIEVPALNHERLTGKLIYVGQTVNPETRTVLVRTEIDNRQGRLKPDMLATMLIAAQPVQQLVVPAAAVVREDNTDHVFVADGQGRFRLTKVNLGPEQNGQRVVNSGLSSGQVIVIEGAYHLNNERKRKELEG